MFEKEYYSNYYKADILDYKLDKHWWSNYYFHRLIRKYSLNRKGNLLEIGCGLGGLLKRLENNFNTYGIEISDYAFNIARKLCLSSNLYLLNADKGLKGRLPDVTFDVIVARHVFEHFEKPEEAIKECASLLNEGGILIFSTPNLSCFTKRLKWKQWNGFRDPSHISLKTPQAWKEYVRNARLNVLKAFSDGLWDFPYFKFIPKIFQYILILPTALEILTVSPFLPAYGESLIVIARKQ